MICKINIREPGIASLFHQTCVTNLIDIDFLRFLFDIRYLVLIYNGENKSP